MNIETTPLPDPEIFESGDLIWPKKPGAFVPYHAGGTGDYEEEKEAWVNERSLYSRSFSANLRQPASHQRDDLSQMSFREFYARYAGDQQPGVPGVYSSGAGIYVGHVGILELDDSGGVWVIEALSGKGVVKQTYSDWLAARPGIIAWHGRVRELDASQRQKIAEESSRYLGKPYDFWNFNLDDDAGFYCSKLVWLSVFRSLGIAIDGNTNPDRSFWFSPKQLLYADRILRLHDPGLYAYS